MGCCNNIKNDEKQFKAFACPKCGKKGNRVEIETPKNLLNESCIGHIEESLEYRYCKNKECKVVYYSSNPHHFFQVSELRVRATHKDKSLDVNICYCFGHTRQSVLDEVKETGETNVLADISDKMKDPGCFCERSNPQGKCCLGNVTAWVKDAKKQKSKQFPFY